MASEAGEEPLRSVPLVISTYSVEETGPSGRAVRKVPRSALAGGPAAVQSLPAGEAALLLLLLLALCCTAVCGVLLTVRQRCSGPRPAASRRPSPCLLPAVSRCVAHKTVLSPLEVPAIAAIHAPRRV